MHDSVFYIHISDFCHIFIKYHFDFRRRIYGSISSRLCCVLWTLKGINFIYTLSNDSSCNVYEYIMPICICINSTVDCSVTQIDILCNMWSICFLVELGEEMLCSGPYCNLLKMQCTHSGVFSHDWMNEYCTLSGLLANTKSKPFNKLCLFACVQFALERLATVVLLHDSELGHLSWYFSELNSTLVCRLLIVIYTNPTFCISIRSDCTCVSDIGYEVRWKWRIRFRSMRQNGLISWHITYVNAQMSFSWKFHSQNSFVRMNSGLTTTPNNNN